MPGGVDDQERPATDDEVIAILHFFPSATGVHDTPETLEKAIQFKQIELVGAHFLRPAAFGNRYVKGIRQFRRVSGCDIIVFMYQKAGTPMLENPLKGSHVIRMGMRTDKRVYAAGFNAKVFHARNQLSNTCLPTTARIDDGKITAIRHKENIG
jgi:hypothetical protein